MQPSSNLPAARDVLAAEHPLCRTLNHIDIVSMQTVTCIALLVGVIAGAYPGITNAGVVAIPDSLVATLLASLLVILRGERYRRGRTVLIQRGAADLAELREVQRHLAAKACRERLADELAHALELALGWQTIPVASRPPPGIRHLTCHADAVRSIVTALGRAGTDVRAVALVEELLEGGYAAPLYHLEARTLGDALERIRFTLAVSSSSERHPCESAAKRGRERLS